MAITLNKEAYANHNNINDDDMIIMLMRRRTKAMMMTLTMMAIETNNKVENYSDNDINDTNDFKTKIIKALCIIICEVVFICGNI